MMLEGLVSKRRDSRYRAGPSRDWIKVKNPKSAAMNRAKDAFGCPVMGWCFLPKGGLVAGDVMLAQKIALENDERAALLVARRFLVNIRRRRHIATRRRFY
jgi:hypothetical protein